MNTNFYRFTTAGDTLPERAFVDTVLYSGDGTVVFEDADENELFEVRSTGPTVSIDIGCMMVSGFRVKSITATTKADIVVR